VQTRSRSLQFAVFVAAGVWYFCARALASSAAAGIALHFELADARQLIDAASLVFLLVIGFALLRAIERRLAPLRVVLGLPRRATARTEWAIGAAIGWALAVAAVLPMAVVRGLRIQLWPTPHALWLLTLGLAALALTTLAQELALRGYPYQRLIEAIGPTRATIAMAVLFAIATGFSQELAQFGGLFGPTEQHPIAGIAITVAVLWSVLLSSAWLRTHGLWLAWGLHFAWTASIAILFGLPSAGATAYSSVVETRAVGPAWLTGATYGPEAGLFTIFVLIAGIVLLVRSTSDFAWDYTHPPLIPAGYDVTILPPAAHVAMEAEAQAKPINPATLVQILPAAPQIPTGTNSSE
jgi:membrane protease YdiL (CAAX protease family)